MLLGSGWAFLHSFHVMRIGTCFPPPLPVNLHLPTDLCCRSDWIREIFQGGEFNQRVARATERKLFRLLVLWPICTPPSILQPNLSSNSGRPTTLPPLFNLDHQHFHQVLSIVFTWPKVSPFINRPIKLFLYSSTSTVLTSPSSSPRPTHIHFGPVSPPLQSNPHVAADRNFSSSDSTLLQDPDRPLLPTPSNLTTSCLVLAYVSAKLRGTSAQGKFIQLHHPAYGLHSPPSKSCQPHFKNLKLRRSGRLRGMRFAASQHFGHHRHYAGLGLPRRGSRDP